MGSNAPFLQPRSGDIELSKHYVAAPRLNMFDPYPTAHAVGYVDVAAPRLREVAYLLIVRHSSLSTKHCQSTKKRTVTPYWPEGALLVALGIRAFLGPRNPAFITPHFRQITMPKTPLLQSQNLLCPFAG